MSRLTGALRDQAVVSVRPVTHGRIDQLVGLQVRVVGVRAAVGDLLEVQGVRRVPLEVVASDRDGLITLPLASTAGLRRGDPVHGTGAPLRIGVGDALRGRILDGLGRPLDGSLPAGLEMVGVEHPTPAALERARIEQQVGLGVRVLDGLVACGRGQRLGIMAGSGVGKSSLLSMIARGTSAEVSVIALIGERGREVREFIENDLGPEGLARSVVVVATADEPPAVRFRAAHVATRIAEWFRDEGRHAVLMMDSLTRVAMAQREIGLSAGEPPATRGYPPSVFTAIPQLVERAGTGPTGSVTGLYTVLVEGDDLQDPVGDASRAVLDGHVVLSRELATSGHFPSVDVLESISRLQRALTDDVQRESATRLRRLLAAYRSVRDLVEIGAYVPGTNPEADQALALMPRINDFLTQDIAESTPLSETWQRLCDLVAS